MRYGSVCSGIEAATVAWHPLGWEPAWFSEIEPFAGDPMFTLPAERPHGVHVGMQVRRLTPVECERLQGFPDGYTAIPGYNPMRTGKFGGNRGVSDGPRYRAIGNSMAIPPMRHIGRAIQRVDDAGSAA